MKSLNELRLCGKQAFDYWAQGQDKDVLDAFPAQALIQVVDDSGSRDWPGVWLAAGGRLFGGRMVALKWDPVWMRISLFGLPYPPFDQFDNMDVEDVDRNEAEQLGLLTSRTRVEPQRRNWRADVKQFYGIDDSNRGQFASLPTPPVIQHSPPIERVIVIEKSPRRKTGFVAGCLATVLVVLGLGAIFSMLSGRPGTNSEGERNSVPPPPKSDPNPADTAYYVGRKACERALKSPATAKFSNPLTDADTGWSPYGFNQWKVFGYVDAQNSLGALLRENWLAVVKKSGEGFDVVYLRLGQTESGKMPEISVAPTLPATPEEIAASKEKANNKKAAVAAAGLKYNQDLAAKGDAYGQLRMGERYLKGDGVEKDEAKARELLGKAAAQGNETAKAILKKLRQEN